jgi:DNA-binding CsgD family transcriptional regulator
MAHRVPNACVVPSEAQLSSLIGDVYDTVLDPSRWNGVLAQVAAFVGGESAGLLLYDLISKNANAHYTFGCNAHYLQLYLDQYAQFDPTSALLFFAPEQVVSIADIMPYDDFLKTRFYREWAQPQGLVDWASAVIEKSPTSFAFLSVLRTRASGMVDDGVRHRMQLLVPHVRRAVLIGKAFDLKTTEAATFADGLDGLGTAMFFVDAIGRLVHANAAGRLMLGSNDLLRAASGRLVAADPQLDQTLHDIFIAASRGDTALGVKGIAIALNSSEGERHVVHVLSLTSGARRRAGATCGAVALLCVQKAAGQLISAPEAIAKAYSLTPTELRVLLAVAEVGGAPAVAKMLGISAGTVKTHLKRLFHKTGTGRQADLIKLVTEFSNPFLD